MVDGCLRSGSLVRGFEWEEGYGTRGVKDVGHKGLPGVEQYGWLVWSWLDEQHLGFPRLVDRAISCVVERVSSV